MSGPSLHKLSAHRSIHNGALSEARDLLELLEQFFHEGKLDYATIAARSLVEHWKTRMIAHADSEEEDNGFYQSRVNENPELEEVVIMLKRDHQHFRTIVNEIEEIIDKEGVNQEVIDRFITLQVLNQIHNKDEETRLFN